MTVVDEIRVRVDQFKQMKLNQQLAELRERLTMLGQMARPGMGFDGLGYVSTSTVRSELEHVLKLAKNIEIVEMINASNPEATPPEDHK